MRKVDCCVYCRKVVQKVGVCLPSAIPAAIREIILENSAVYSVVLSI